jgi:hypothetical protein
MPKITEEKLAELRSQFPDAVMLGNPNEDLEAVLRPPTTVEWDMCVESTNSKDPATRKNADRVFVMAICLHPDPKGADFQKTAARYPIWVAKLAVQGAKLAGAEIEFSVKKL